MSTNQQEIEQRIAAMELLLQRGYISRKVSRVHAEG